MSWFLNIIEKYFAWFLNYIKGFDIYYGCPASKKAKKLQMKRRLYK